MSWDDQDARDVEMQREVEEAFADFLCAKAADRLNARLRYLELLKAFTARVVYNRWPEISF